MGALAAAEVVPHCTSEVLLFITSEVFKLPRFHFYSILLMSEIQCKTVKMYWQVARIPCNWVCVCLAWKSWKPFSRRSWAGANTTLAQSATRHLFLTQANNQIMTVTDELSVPVRLNTAHTDKYTNKIEECVHSRAGLKNLKEKIAGIFSSPG